MRFWRGQNSLFLLMYPWRIFDNQRVTQTEKGSDLTTYAAPFFVVIIYLQQVITGFQPCDFPHLSVFPAWI